MSSRNTREGGTKNTVGKIKEAAGKAVGNDRLKREGQADQVEGNAQKTVGKVEDAVRDKH